MVLVREGGRKGLLVPVMRTEANHTQGYSGHCR